LVEKRKANAPTEEEKKRYEKYFVQNADLDLDPLTQDNVIVFSDKDKYKIKSIDGYENVPAQRKQAQRILYSTYPSKNARSLGMNSQHRSD
jgi:hypothetical protein